MDEERGSRFLKPISAIMVLQNTLIEGAVVRIICVVKFCLEIWGSEGSRTNIVFMRMIFGVWIGLDPTFWGMNWQFARRESLL